jgi:hypothetical protein
MNSKNKTIIIILLTAMLSLLFVRQIYHIVDKRDRKVVAQTPEYLAEVETQSKKLLNGYLGVIFRFRYMGNINWLALPLVLWFLFTAKLKKRERWQLALVFVWLISLLFIGFKGYYNARYQLTLFPFTMGMVLVLLWELIKERQLIIKVLVFSIVAGFCLVNIYHYYPHFKLYWDLKISRTRKHFPEKIMSFLTENKEIARGRNRVYVFDEPLYYYHTQKFGVDYKSPYFIILYANLAPQRMNLDKLYTLIYKKHRIKYIFISWTMENQYKKRVLTEFLNSECKLLFNEHGYRFYEVRHPRLEMELKKSQYHQLEIVQTKNIRVQGGRGTFHIHKDKKTSQVTIRHKEANKNGLRMVQVGFDSAAKRFNLEVPEEKYIHFIIEAKVSQSIMNRSSYMFLRDFKDGKWEREKLYFAADIFRKYVISKKIRKGSERFQLGVHLEPNSPKESLVIKKIRAYVSMEEL